jgi:hypothetical protein
MKKLDKDKEIHMSTEPAKRDDVWWDGKAYIPFTEMTDVHLQRAKMFAQKKELNYFERTGMFAELADKLDEEAAKRGLTLKDYDANYFKNKKAYEERMKNGEV